MHHHASQKPTSLKSCWQKYGGRSPITTPKGRHLAWTGCQAFKTSEAFLKSLQKARPNANGGRTRVSHSAPSHSDSLRAAEHSRRHKGPPAPAAPRPPRPHGQALAACARVRPLPRRAGAEAAPSLPRAEGGLGRGDGRPAQARRAFCTAPPEKIGVNVLHPSFLKMAPKTPSASPARPHRPPTRPRRGWAATANATATMRSPTLGPSRSGEDLTRATSAVSFAGRSAPGPTHHHRAPPPAPPLAPPARH